MIENNPVFECIYPIHPDRNQSLIHSEIKQPIFPFSNTLLHPHHFTTLKADVEEKLIRSEANLRLAQKVAQVGSWELDVETQQMSWSEEMFRIFGYSPTELEPTLKDYVDHVHPDDQLRWQTLMGQALIEGTPYELDFRLLSSDGAVRYVAAKCETVIDDEGRVSHLFGTILDITERKRAEDGLRSQAQRERLRATISEKIRKSLDLNTILQTTVKEIRDFLHIDRAFIYRFDADWTGTVAVESVGEGWLSLLGTNIQDECFRETHVPLYAQGRIRSIPDIYNANLDPCHIELLEQYQVRANLIVPIMQSEKLWGLLIAHHCQDVHKWHIDEIYLIQQLTVQLDIALQQAELYQQLQTELEERKQVEAALRQSEFRFRQQALELEKTLAELQKAQTHLIQNEKMSSLGQLVAGIAHEINNPINFIFGNLTYVEEYTQDLLTLLHLYQTIYPQPTAVLQHAIADQDVGYIVADLSKILKSMRVGTERIREIVKSLRTFSRLDESEFKAVDIHDGIESTFMILSHRFKAKPGHPGIHIIKKYGDLPAVKCYPSQLNQVVMNLLSNAIDALEDRIKQEVAGVNPQPQTLPTIQIQTECISAETIAIRISDNGLGIPIAIRHRIFDPFFTTKPVGQGTGMGLAISYQLIVDKHQGQLKVNTESGKGTEFIIEIPANQKRSNTDSSAL